MKTCFKCQEKKPLVEFYKHKRMADGHLNKCKECAKADARKHRAENVDYYREYDKWRGRSFGRKSAKRIAEKARASRRAWNKANKEKLRCHKKVKRAVRSGVLLKPSECQNCGQSFPSHKIHGHHEDYSRPLEVKWFCYSCHASHHAADVSGFKPKRTRVYAHG